MTQYCFTLARRVRAFCLALVLEPNRQTICAQGVGLAADRPRNRLSDRADGRQWNRCRPSGYRGKGVSSSSANLPPGCVNHFRFSRVRQQAAPVVLAVIQRAIVEAFRLFPIVQRMLKGAGSHSGRFRLFSLWHPCRAKNFNLVSWCIVHGCFSYSLFSVCYKMRALCYTVLHFGKKSSLFRHIAHLAR